MSWTPVNEIKIQRIFNPKREVVITWVDMISGEMVSKFPFENSEEVGQESHKKGYTMSLKNGEDVYFIEGRQPLESSH